MTLSVWFPEITGLVLNIEEEIIGWKLIKKKSTINNNYQSCSLIYSILIMQLPLDLIDFQLVYLILYQYCIRHLITFAIS